MPSTRITLPSAVALILSVSQLGTGDVLVWWELADGPGVVQQQGPGQTLVIATDPTPGTDRFRLRMMASIDSGELLWGHSTDLYRFGDSSMSTIVAAAQIGWFVQFPGTINMGPLLVEGIGEATFGMFLPGPIGGGPHALLEWQLEVVQDGLPHQVFQGIGENFFAPAGLLVSLGPNAPVSHDNRAPRPIPVVTFAPIPEPAGIAALSACMIVLIRRASQFHRSGCHV